MEDVIKAETSWGCLVCKKPGRKGARVVSVGGFYRHPACVSDPAPTVDAMDDEVISMPDGGRLVIPAGLEFDMADPSPLVEEFQKMAAEGLKTPGKGPWFGAMYDGRCDSCSDRIFEGDRIRADGQGGYECEDCGESEDPAPKPSDWQAQASAAAARYVAALDGIGEVAELRILVPADDLFDTPSPVGDAEPVMSVSGQPKKVLRDHLDRYAVVLPGETELELYKSSGNPVGRTRATTFNKAAQQSKAINDWGKRNIVIGAARRRDLILKAHDLTHERDRDKLDSLVKQLEEAAGSKVGSDLGTFLHEFTEYMDAGLKRPDQAPEEFRQSLRAYAQALEDAGLEPIRSLIERTTIIREYGWVCGTFDRIMYHRPSGQYVIVDLKTGKTMDYGKNEIECQLWTYAHGVNQNGVYDWNTRTWEMPQAPAGTRAPDGMTVGVEVSETVGIVIHMPVQGPLEGTVQLLWADLESGAAHARVCADVRARPGGKMKPFDGSLLAPLAPPSPVTVKTWEESFQAVTTTEEANALWYAAKAGGVTGVRLADLVSVAQQRLRELGVKG